MTVIDKKCYNLKLHYSLNGDFSYTTLLSKSPPPRGRWRGLFCLAMQLHHKPCALCELLIKTEIAIELVCHKGTGWEFHTIIHGEITNLGKCLEDILTLVCRNLETNACYNEVTCFLNSRLMRSVSLLLASSEIRATRSCFRASSFEGKVMP